MTPLHELTNMQVDGRDAGQSLDCSRRGGTKCPCDPSTGASLHGPECLHRALKMAALIVPELGAI